MHSARLLLAGLLLASTTAISPASADASAPLVPLTSTVRITTDAVAVARVDVPAGATLDLLPDDDGEFPAVDIEGPGRLVGFYIVPRAGEPFEGFVTLLRLPKPVKTVRYAKNAFGADRKPCPDLSRGSVGLDPAPCLLAAGENLIYAVTDGSPIEITLRLKNVPNGETDFCFGESCEAGSTPMTPAVGGVQVPASTTDVSAPFVAGLRSASVTETLTDATDIFFGFLFVGGYEQPAPAPAPRHGGTGAGGMCLYDGPAPSYGVQPGCPETREAAKPNCVVTPTQGGWGCGTSDTRRYPPAGVRTFGGYQIGAGTNDVFLLGTLRLDRPESLR